MSRDAAPPSASPATLAAEEAVARRLDAEDPLAQYRSRFAIPRRDDGTAVHYFCGNSLGLQPLRARDLVLQELDEQLHVLLGFVGLAT